MKSTEIRSQNVTLLFNILGSNREPDPYSQQKLGVGKVAAPGNVGLHHSLHLSRAVILDQLNPLQHMPGSIHKFVALLDCEPHLVVYSKNEEADLFQVCQVLAHQAVHPGPQVQEPVGSGEPAAVVHWADHHDLEACTCVSGRHSRKCITLLKLMTELMYFFLIS